MIRHILLWLLSPEYRAWRKLDRKLPTVDEFERRLRDE
jgi:hypothetical protein